jgi:GNAT superfamily N-acetyltransferase
MHATVDIQEDLSNLVIDSFLALGITPQSNGKATYFLSGMENPMMNIVCRVENPHIKQEDANKIANFYRENRSGFCWWMAGHVEERLHKMILESGTTYLGKFPGMALELETRKKFSPLPNLAIVETVEEEQFMQMGNLVRECFEWPPNDAQIFANAYLKEHQKKHHIINNLLAYNDGKPIGVGSVILHKPSAIICNFSTLPHHRHQGVATTILMHLLQKAEHHGCSHAILISSSIAYSLFNKMGFEDVISFHLYISK